MKRNKNKRLEKHGRKRKKKEERKYQKRRGIWEGEGGICWNLRHWEGRKAYELQAPGKQSPYPMSREQSGRGRKRDCEAGGREKKRNLYETKREMVEGGGGIKGERRRNRAPLQ